MGAQYATVQDAVDLYGEMQIMVLCDRDLDGVIDTSSFEQHLRIASQQIDMYLLGRYPLPLALPPEYFKKLCVDLARNSVTGTADVKTEIIKENAKAAISMLEMIAKNQLKLEVAPSVTTANTSASPAIEIGRRMEFECGARQFTANKLKCLI